MSGLEGARAGLEHRPRNPFAVGVKAALEALRLEWGDGFLIWHEGGLWHADPRTGPGAVLTCETPDGLVRAMRGAR